ncbi:MAG: hypothetical protein AAGA30_16765 [Planctomycetota bacterium]
MPSIEQLEDLLKSSPEDIFLNYALAMELDNCGQHDRSLDIFDTLIKQEPPYVPAFFMAAQQLTRLSRINEAREKLRDGIQQARTQNDSHAAAEMSEFLTSLGELGE